MSTTVMAKHEDKTVTRQLPRWPLAAVLALQAILTWFVPAKTNGPSNDEALYLRVGRLELAHWLHGSSAPAVEKFFSGAPILYPPLGAIADNIGGLTGARLLSMVFMLGATALLWSTTSRLLGRLAAVCSSALFAVLASALHVGSLATYDALALSLLALAGFCVVRPGSRWLAASAAALVAANATKYASALFDPVVFVAAVLSSAQSGHWRSGIWRGAALAGGTLAALAGLLALGGRSYWVGVKVTTLTRHVSTNSVSSVLAHAAGWSWAIIVLAAIGIVVSAVSGQPRAGTALLAVFAFAGCLAPLEQAKIHTLLSLDKHVAFGAWFAAIPAGYALSRAIQKAYSRYTLMTGQRLRIKILAAGACVVVVALLSALGLDQGRQMAGYSRTVYLIPALRPLTAQGGHFLSDTANVDAYALSTVPWKDWTRLRPDEPEARTQALASHIVREQYKLVVLSAGRAGTPQAQLRAVLKQVSAYHLIRKVPDSGPQHHLMLIWQLRRS